MHSSCSRERECCCSSNVDVTNARVCLLKKRAQEFLYFRLCLHFEYFHFFHHRCSLFSLTLSTIHNERDAQAGQQAWQEHVGEACNHRSFGYTSPTPSTSRRTVLSPPSFLLAMWIEFSFSAFHNNFSSTKAAKNIAKLQLNAPIHFVAWLKCTLHWKLLHMQTLAILPTHSRVYVWEQKKKWNDCIN